MANPTLRSLAKTLQLSHATVSSALRGSSLVRPETAQRVRAAAAAAGYRLNPLAGALMSELRRSRGNLFRGVLGVIVLHEPERPKYGLKFFEAMIKGMRARATDLGFKLEVFTAGDERLSLKRLESILLARGITGLILMPAWWDPNFRELDWSRFAGVYADYIIKEPPLHSVSPDHYRALTEALPRLIGMGYKRPGFFIRRRHNDRLQRRWAGAFAAFQENTPGIDQVPPLIEDLVEKDNFVRWFQRYKPDLVIGHQPEAMTWMRSCGARIPKTHGFFCLNLLMTQQPCAGIDLQPSLIGFHSVDIVTAQLYRNELGVPHHGVLTTVAATFVDGPTIRPMQPAKGTPAGGNPSPVEEKPRKNVASKRREGPREKPATPGLSGETARWRTVLKNAAAG